MDSKAEAKRLKAKGLGKLRWYCQMCEKQCRDANGYKNHCSTAGHERQMRRLEASKGELLETFSQKLLDGFLECLRLRYGTCQVNANTAYQEYIRDRHHVHMNATQWESLREFVAFLGRHGHCRVEQNAEGIFMISYIDCRTAELEAQAHELERAQQREELEQQRRLEQNMMKSVERRIAARVSRGEQPETDAEKVQAAVLPSEHERKTVGMVLKRPPTRTTVAVPVAHGKPVNVFKVASTAAASASPLAENQGSGSHSTCNKSPQSLDLVQEEDGGMRRERKQRWS
ncbi:KIN17-like protein [Porphyridium purpureum]|uniref:KIN17-like protein n=1 Tax=Porphyridium purpureum TaxID=35688 RepID=A0A5J4Z154_PORPP|nr:KIN17-like protein [Porphyridium purpureum]|eukprot:POR4573..scf208_2